MDDTKSTSRIQGAIISVATNETFQGPDRAASNILTIDNQNQKDDKNVEVGDVEIYTPEQDLPASEKVKLQDQTNLLPLKQLLIVFAGLSCALFCSLLDQTIVATALPTLGRVFNDASISSWVGTAYLLSSTAFQPMYGRLSDIFGRKIILLASMGCFLLGSILCAVSQSMTMLIVFRAISGIGGGGILTSVMITVSDVVSLEKRGRYQGILGMVVAIANSIGPLIGGIFTEKVSWRWCFYINIPLTSIAMIIVALVLPLKRVKGNAKEKLKKIDYLGSLTMLSSSLLILLPLSWGGTKYPWNSIGVIALLVIGTVLLGVFIFVEVKVAKLPLIPMHIFKNPTVLGSVGGSFLTGFVTFSNLYYLPQFYQVVRRASPIHSGVMLIPLVVTQTVTSFTSGFIVSKTGNYRFQLWIGFAIWTVASGLLSTISPTTSNAKLIGYQMLSGIGAGQTFQTSLIAIQASVKRSEMAVATGMRNFLRMLGGTVALAACAAILNNTAKTELVSVLPYDTIQAIIADPTRITSGKLGLTVPQQSAALLAYSHGIRNIFYFMIPCCCISFFLTVFLVKAHPLRREDDAKLQEAGKEWAAKHNGLHALGRKKKNGSGEVTIESGTSETAISPADSGENPGVWDKTEGGREKV
ncbi:putative tetracycline efflux protein [Stipitochalara longipes BDJ]|nr:putative tetracycline efflux protein [Stipitochalara longipes BDJ]